MNSWYLWISDSTALFLGRWGVCNKNELPRLEGHWSSLFSSWAGLLSPGQPQVWWLCFLRRTGLVLIRPPLQESGGKEPRCRPCWAEAALVCCGELGEALYWDRQQASPWNGDPRRSGLGWAARRSQPRSVSSSEQETEGTHLLYNSDFKFAWLEKWFAQWW